MSYSVVGEERKQEWAGSLYVIRDVWDAELSPEGFKTRLERCEYAVKNDENQTVWKPCREGVEFSEIEPFEDAA